MVRGPPSTKYPPSAGTWTLSVGAQVLRTLGIDQVIDVMLANGERVVASVPDAKTQILF